MKKTIILIVMMLLKIDLWAKDDINYDNLGFVQIINEAEIDNIVESILEMPKTESKNLILHFEETMTSIPDKLFDIPNIVGIQYEGDILNYVSDRLFDYTSIRRLLIENATIPKPDEFCKKLKKLKNLEAVSLKIDENSMRQIFELTNLKYIVLTSTNKSNFRVPDNIGNFDGLIQFYLENFHTITFPNSISNCKTIRNIKLSADSIDWRNLELIDKSMLTSLDISCLQPQNDTFTISNCNEFKNIKFLYYQGYHITPSVIDSLKKIRSLQSIVFRNCNFDNRTLISIEKSDLDMEFRIYMSCDNFIPFYEMRRFSKSKRPRIEFYFKNMRYE